MHRRIPPALPPPEAVRPLGRYHGRSDVWLLLCGGVGVSGGWWGYVMDWVQVWAGVVAGMVLVNNCNEKSPKDALAGLIAAIIMCVPFGRVWGWW